MSGKTLKYVRTTQGFTVFPCLAATHEMIAKAMGWPVVSAGFVDWDFDGHPICYGNSDTLKLDSLWSDTNALRTEWGMAPAATEPLPPAAMAAARAFGADLDDRSLEQPEVL